MISVESYEVIVTPLDEKKTFYDSTITLGYTKLYWRYQRIYSKIQDVLAQVGGVIKAIFTFFQVINFFFNKWYLDLYLLSLTETQQNKVRDRKLIKIPNNLNEFKKPKENKMNVLDKSQKENSISMNKLQVDKTKTNDHLPQKRRWIYIEKLVSVIMLSICCNVVMIKLLKAKIF